MLCNYPWRLYDKKDGSFKIMPCGKCKGCKIAHSREWAFRLLAELKEWNGEGVFLTLTYDDEHLNNPSLNYPDFQKFIKDLRYDIYPRKLKFYMCGEYGDQFSRKHMHAIIFGLTLNDKEIIKQNWNYGFIKVGTVTYDSCRYVAAYVNKKYGKQKNEELYISKGLKPPFQNCSKGLGLKFAVDNIKQLEQNNLSLNGKKIAVPRYFVKKLGIDVASDHNVINDMRAEKISYKLDTKEYQQFLDRKGKQKELTMELDKRNKRTSF